MDNRSIDISEYGISYSNLTQSNYGSFMDLAGSRTEIFLAENVSVFQVAIFSMNAASTDDMDTLLAPVSKMNFNGRSLIVQGIS